LESVEYLATENVPENSDRVRALFPRAPDERQFLRWQKTFYFWTELHQREQEMLDSRIRVASRKHLQDVASQVLFDFAMPRNRLRHFGRLILIPIVLPAMPDKHAVQSLNFLN
jgi:hypothetical protein